VPFHSYFRRKLNPVDLQYKSGTVSLTAVDDLSSFCACAEAGLSRLLLGSG
jgi:hypothetical protein